jgi:hypothetical protein
MNAWPHRGWKGILSYNRVGAFWAAHGVLLFSVVWLRRSSSQS